MSTLAILVIGLPWVWLCWKAGMAFNRWMLRRVYGSEGIQWDGSLLTIRQAMLEASEKQARARRPT